MGTKPIRVGCAVLVERDNALLLGVRGKEPNYGKIIIPGGGVNFLEHLKETAQREILEETSIEIEIIKQFNTYEIIVPPDEHRVIVYFKARYVSGNLMPSSDLLDARFYAKSEIYELYKSGSISSLVEQVLKDSKWL